MGHHYTPQAYLRPFQAPEAPGMIWTYPRNAEPRLAPIKNVAQAGGFYDPDVESDLNTHIEAPANPILDKLRRGQMINGEERQRVAVYIATMLYRVPRNRERGEALIPEARDDTISKARRALVERAVFGGVPLKRLQGWLTNLRTVKEQWDVETPTAVTEEVRKPWPSELVVRLIHAMQWRVLVAEPPEMFITSDNPAFFFESIGMAKDDAELSLPLSPSHCLHGSHQLIAGDRLDYMSFDRETVREMNRRIASAATSIVMAHEKQAWIIKLLRKKPDLHRMSWST